MSRPQLAAIGAVAGLAVLAGVAHAGPRPDVTTRLLARATGTNILLSAGTSGLRYGVWLHQTRGDGSTRAKASTTCRQQQRASRRATSFFTSGSGEWHELWRTRSGGDCTVRLTLTAPATITVELRGR